MKPPINIAAKSVCIGLIGTLVFVFGVLLLLLWSALFDFIVASMQVLKPNTQILDMWQKPPMTLALDFYFFNWTNPDEIHDPNKKPKFQEIGPYRFREDREKVNLTWNSNHTVTYRLLRNWYFDRENSVGALSDEVTTLNAVTISAAHQVKNWSYFMKRGFSLSMAAIAPHVHITKPVGQLLFEGFQDPYVDLALTLPFLADTLPPFDKFGWFYGRNESYTYDGTFNMGTGEDGNFGELLRWNYNEQTPFFKGSCGKVHGSAAELYSGKQYKDHIGFFSPDMCRHVQLDYEEDIIVKDVGAYKYSAQEGMLDNGTILPENECYCDGECVPSGLLNVSSCRYGTPSFVSLPHYYGADPSYLTMVEGLKPNKSKHEMFIALEPNTGIPMDVAIRLQLNIMLYPIEHITLYENVPKVFFPMLWFEQKVSIPDDLARMVSLLISTRTILPVLAYILIIIGFCTLVYTTTKIMITRYFRYENTCLSRDDFPIHPNSYIPLKRKLSIIDLIYS